MRGAPAGGSRRFFPHLLVPPVAATGGRTECRRMTARRLRSATSAQTAARTGGFTATTGHWASSLVAEQADRVAIMYAGNVVETGTVAEVFGNPRHPYTKGLLDSVPVSAERGADLKSIGGTPPDLHSIPSGCVYQARCPLARARCIAERPALRSVGAQRAAACHFSEETSNV